MISVAILAGGRGERLGCEKAAALLNGEPLLAHVIRRMAPLGSDDLLLVLRPGQMPAVVGVGRPVYDADGTRGVLAGMAAALSAARHPWVGIVACDMPWASPALLRYQYQLRHRYDAVVPRLAMGLEPLHALYHRRCLPTILAALAAGERRVTAVLPKLRVRYVDEKELRRVDGQGLAFCNINSPEQLAEAERRLRVDRGRAAAG